MTERFLLQSRIKQLKRLPLVDFQTGSHKTYIEMSDEDLAMDCAVLLAVVDKTETVEFTYSKTVDKTKTRKTTSKKNIPKMLIVMDHSGNPGAVFISEDQAGTLGTHCKPFFQQGTGVPPFFSTLFCFPPLPLFHFLRFNQLHTTYTLTILHHQ